MAQDHIANHIVQARTPEHKLEVALAMRGTLAQVPLNEARISKLCTRDAELLDIVVLRLDLETGESSVGAGEQEALAERCRKLAEEVLRERVEVTEGEPQEEKGEGGSLNGHTLNSETLHNPKLLQQGKRIALHELWDEEKKQFVTGEDDMADTIKGARRKLEHTDYMKEQPNRNRRESRN